MATKAQIQALIDAQITSGAPQITAVEHRDVLKDNANSILNELYGDVQEYTHLDGNTFFTLIQDPAAQYVIRVCKQGRQVHMTGNIIAVGFITNFANIQAGEFSARVNSFNYGMAFNLNLPLNPAKQVGVSEQAGVTRLRFKGAIAPGQRVNFHVTYLTES